MQMKIMRGLSGSGKSTKARQIMDSFLEEYPALSAVICSADYFFVDSSGEYKFDANKLGQAHAFCRGMVDAATRVGVDLIIIDNTNTRKWEYQSYLDMAKEARYEVEEIIVGDLDEESILKYAKRNAHGVPLETIMKMADRFEK